MNSRANDRDDLLAKLMTDLARVTENLAALTARVDATFPHLATKADLSDTSDRLLRWIVSLLVTAMLILFAAYSSSTSRLDSTLQATVATQQKMQLDLQKLAADQQKMAANQQKMTVDQQKLATDQQNALEEAIRAQSRSFSADLEKLGEKRTRNRAH